jgi:Flp pilus assembly protein TadD
VKNLAEFYFVELGWTDDAIMMLTGLLRNQPEDVEILIALGLISERIGRDNEARSFYRRALDLAPANASVREALTRLEGGTPPVAEYRPAAPVQPAVPATTAEPPSQQSSQLEDVLARLRASIDTRSAGSAPSPAKTADELYREAQDAANRGDDDKAIGTLESLKADYPMYALAFNDLGVLYTRHGDLQKALLNHETAVGRDPGNPTFRKNLAALYYSCLGRTDEAIEMYTRLLREYPQDVEVLTALAIISDANNLRDQAATFIRKVLDLEPWNTAAREFLAGL